MKINDDDIIHWEEIDFLIKKSGSKEERNIKILYYVQIKYQKFRKSNEILPQNDDQSSNQTMNKTQEITPNENIDDNPIKTIENINVITLDKTGMVYCNYNCLFMCNERFNNNQIEFFFCAKSECLCENKVEIMKSK